MKIPRSVIIVLLLAVIALTSAILLSSYLFYYSMSNSFSAGRWLQFFVIFLSWDVIYHRRILCLETIFINEGSPVICIMDSTGSDWPPANPRTYTNGGAA